MIDRYQPPWGRWCSIRATLTCQARIRREHIQESTGAGALSMQGLTGDDALARVVIPGESMLAVRHRQGCPTDRSQGRRPGQQGGPARPRGVLPADGRRSRRARRPPAVLATGPLSPATAPAVREDCLGPEVPDDVVQDQADARPQTTRGVDLRAAAEMVEATGPHVAVNAAGVWARTRRRRETPPWGGACHERRSPERRYSSWRRACHDDRHCTSPCWDPPGERMLTRPDRGTTVARDRAPAAPRVSGHAAQRAGGC